MVGIAPGIGGAQGAAETVLRNMANGRLSAHASTPLSLASGATLYYLPWNGDLISLYNSGWAYRSIGSGLSVPLSTNDLDGAAISSSSVYYAVVFYDGSLNLRLKKWTGVNTPAATQYQDGVLVLDSAPDKRVVGAVRTSSTTQIVNQVGRRYVDNLYNRRKYCDVTYYPSSSPYTILNSVGPQALDAGGSGPYDEFQHRFVETIPGDVFAQLDLQMGSFVGGIAYDSWIEFVPGSGSASVAGEKKQLGTATPVHCKGSAQGVVGYNSLVAYEETSAAGTQVSVALSPYCGFSAEGYW